MSSITNSITVSAPANREPLGNPAQRYAELLISVAEYLDHYADELETIYEAMRPHLGCNADPVIIARNQLDRGASDMRKRAQFFIDHPDQIPSAK